MPRRKNVIAPEAKAMDLVAQDHKQQELTAVKAFEMYGFKDIQNYDLFVYKQKIGLFLQLANRSIIEAGRGLLVIKAQEPHGVFLKTIESLGLAERTVRRYMHIARRFGKTANLAVLPTSKLEALEELDDPTLEKLDAGEDVLGLTIEGIDAMPASVVRKKAKELEAKLATQKERYKKEIEAQLDEIKDLKMRASSIEPPTKEKIAEKRLEELNKDYFGSLMSGIADIRKALDTISKAEQVENITYPMIRAWMNRYAEGVEGLTAAYQDLMDAVKQPYIDNSNIENGR